MSGFQSVKTSKCYRVSEEQQCTYVSHVSPEDFCYKLCEESLCCRTRYSRSRTMFHTCTVDSDTAHSGHVHILYIITLRDTLTSKGPTASLNSSPGHEVDPCGKLLLRHASYQLFLFWSPSLKSLLSLSLLLSHRIRHSWS